MEAGSDNQQYDSNRSSPGLFLFMFSLFRERSLIALLVSTNLRSRYRRSLLGLFWTLANPIISSLVLWMIFVTIFKSRLIDGTQFAPYLLAGVLTITFFHQGVMQVAESISEGPKLFLKIRVDPRLFCFSHALSNAANFFLGILALAVVTWIARAAISIKFPLVFLVGMCLTMLVFGVGLILSILFVRFDDFKYITTILLQLLTYLTPVFYPKEILNSQIRLLVSLNPLTSILDVFRNVFNGTEIATMFDWAYMLGSSTLAFTVGILLFRRYWPKTLVML
jgi:ABC-type polysaccharide/polyol phosphate export permease